MNKQLTKTDAIIAYDRGYLTNDELSGTAKYLAQADQKERDRFMRANPAIAAAVWTLRYKAVPNA